MSPPPTTSKPKDDDDSTYRLSKESPIAPEGIVPPPPVESPFFKKPAKAKSPQKQGTLVGLNALVFVTSVCVMTLELTASRLIAKHVGSSLYTWTSVIGVVLAGITLGNWLGGWMADRFDRRRSLAWMYLFGSLSCGSVLWLDQFVGNLPRPETLNWPQWVVTIVGAIFFAPALALGTTSPLVASMALERSWKTGSTVGNVYAWGALGSIVGTFLTGFYLIDVWGTRSIIGMTAGTLGILAVIVAGQRTMFRAVVVMGWMQLLGWILLAANSNAKAFEAVGIAAANCASVVQSATDAHATRKQLEEVARSIGTRFHELGLLLRLRDDEIDEYRDESNYSDIRIAETLIDEHRVKSLRLDKLIHSYYDQNEPTKLHYNYERVYAAVTKRAAVPASTEPLTVPLTQASGIKLDLNQLPSGVTLDAAKQNLRIEFPSNDVFAQLLAFAPEARYWSALEELLRTTNQVSWGGFSGVNLAELPHGVAIPEKFAELLRYDEGLKVLVAYKPLTQAIVDELISQTGSGHWYQVIDDVRRSSLKTTACFYGGGGFIFPRWFLKEFPGSPRIDIAELDPAVYKAVKTELGLNPEQDARMHTFVNDARNFVDDQLRENVHRKSTNQPLITYDFIYADAFNDFSIPWHLTTLEFLQKTNDLMSDRGVFQANIIDIYPRVEFPGTKVGKAGVEYEGRLPIGIAVDTPKRDRLEQAAAPYAPLEFMELVASKHRLLINRALTPGEERKLMQVNWETVKPTTRLEVEKGFQPAIDNEVERKNWNAAIKELVRLSNQKSTCAGVIPDGLKIPRDSLNAWAQAASPFDYVEIYRNGRDNYVVGLRGRVTTEEMNKLIDLAPQDGTWTNAVKLASAKTQIPGAGRFLGRYVATAARVFPNIYLFSTSHQNPHDDRDTFVMVCSRRPLDLKSLDDTGDWHGGPFASLENLSDQKEPVFGGQMHAVIALSENQILTDDFAPVENLLVPVFNTQE